jgi:hypothetical protein
MARWMRSGVSSGHRAGAYPEAPPGSHRQGGRYLGQKGRDTVPPTPTPTSTRARMIRPHPQGAMSPSASPAASAHRPISLKASTPPLTASHPVSGARHGGS